MSTDIKITAIEEDFESVARHAFNRESLDPDVARRVQERAAHVTEKLRLTHGVIDDATFIVGHAASLDLEGSRASGRFP